jgi:putative iron-regulated protein
MRNLSFFKTPIFFILIASLLTACGDGGTVDPTADYSEVLEDLTTDVIVSTYSSLDDKAQELLIAVNALKNDPTEANLTLAREAWIATREPWEQSEGFLFGPVDTEGIDPALDSWPVNQVDLENVLASNDDLTASFVASLEGTLKGFHTIEFLLWGADGQKVVTDLTSREFEYLVSTTEVLADDAASLANAWESSGENFAINVINAGESTSIYISQKAALEELASGVLGIADEVGNGKINDPLEQEDLSLEESQFSDNSKTDFTNNIRSIQNVYVGVNGKGLSSVVAEEDADLDTQIKAEIQAAIDAIQAIPGTFTEAIPSSSATRVDAESAQAKVRTLQATFESRLIPLVSGL